MVNQVKHYRKVVVGRCQQLRYLDDRPVFPDERRRCDVWYRTFLEQGDKAAMEAEREEIKRLRGE